MNISRMFVLLACWILSLPLLTVDTLAAQDELELDSLGVLAPSTAVIAGLEATNLQIVGTTAYVVYNTAGPVVHGAIEAVDVSDSANPKRLGVHLYENAEFSDIAVHAKVAYLTGDVNLPDHQGAVLKVIDLTNPTLLPEQAEINLPGYTATSIRLDGDEAVLSVGDDAGLSVFDISKPNAPKLTLQLPFANALYSARYGSGYLALGGTSQTEVALFSKTGANQAPALDLSSQATTSPGRFEVRGHYLYTNAGHTGLSIVELPHFFSSSLKLVSQTSLQGDGNGLVLFGHYAFLAQGNLGLRAFDVADKKAPRDLGALAFNFPAESTNQVRFVRDRAQCARARLCGLLYVANGKGGLRILALHGSLAM